jgi:hypothetical protein
VLTYSEIAWSLCLYTLFVLQRKLRVHDSLVARQFFGRGMNAPLIAFGPAGRIGLLGNTLMARGEIRSLAASVKLPPPHLVFDISETRFLKLSAEPLAGCASQLAINV